MARSARQLLLGVAVGVGLVAMMPDLSLDGLIIEIDSTLIVAVAGLLLVVGLLARRDRRERGFGCSRRRR